MDQVVARLEERIEKLSAQSRRQRAWLIALSTVLVGCAITAARDPDHDIVRARQFEAIDAEGRVVAMLTSEGNSGAPMLALLDERGEVFASLTRVVNRMDATSEDAAEQGKLVMLSLQASNDPSYGDYGVTTLAAMPRGGFLTLIHNDDKDIHERIALGVIGDRLNLSIEHGAEAPPLLEFHAVDGNGELEINDGEGKSLLRVP